MNERERTARIVTNGPFYRIQFDDGSFQVMRETGEPANYGAIWAAQAALERLVNPPNYDGPWVPVED